MGLSRKFRRGITEGPTPADALSTPRLPYPGGWSAVAFSEELKPGRVLTRPLMGEDVVLYRMRSGGIRAVRPYCPHLGAHLGLGDVEGDDLVCPFHRFAFGPDGSCVRTAYGASPPKASLVHLPVCEVNDAVFVWRHHDADRPQWDIPAWHTVGRPPVRHATWEMAGHAQEVMENAVDLGHFAALHGWANAELASPVVFEGVRFHVSMRVTERFPLLGEHRVEIEVDGHGLSALHTDVRTPGLGLEMCTLVTATMIAPGRMQFRQASRFAVAAPARWSPRAARLLGRALSRVLARPMFRWSCDFTAADFPIWNTKEYTSPPRLAPGDGPIGPFRHWARQFYPQNVGSQVLPGPGTGTGTKSSGSGHSGTAPSPPRQLSTEH
ncbi:Rieske 2Fe-2S domain-containing protein [Streptomyces sp. NPDC001922]|uniref:Rieske 2Fe-2S domain-containing protein n=1 Tax=Streptomyces sp. NPDC001922 TaxID=3364624 RepID=UPI0036C2CAFF